MRRRGPRPPELLVVKVGGSCLENLDPDWWDRLVELVRAPGDAGGEGFDGNGSPRRTKLAVVHGWSRMVSAATPAGQPDFIVDKHGFRSRYTTPAVLEEIERVASSLRERIASLLRERGLRTQAVSGAESRLLHAEVRRNMWWVGDELVPLTNLVGPVRDVDRARLDVLLAESDAIVVSPLAVAAAIPEEADGDGGPAGGRDEGEADGDGGRDEGEADGDGGPVGRRGAGRRRRRLRHVNTDADRAAAAIARAGSARRLALVMDAEAVLADGEPVRNAVRDDLRALAGHAEGGMAKKLRAVEEAFAGGVREVAIGSAPVPDLLAGRSGTLIAAEPDRTG